MKTYNFKNVYVTRYTYRLPTKKINENKLRNLIRYKKIASIFTATTILLLDFIHTTYAKYIL